MHDPNAPVPQTRTALKGVLQNKTKPFKEWEKYTEPKAGTFFVEHGQLRELRAEFMRNGQCPRTTMKDLFDIKRIVLRVDVDGKKRAGECHIYEMPRYCDVMRIWVDLMQSVRPIKWCGLGSLTLLLIKTLMEPQLEKGRRTRETPSLTRPKTSV